MPSTSIRIDEQALAVLRELAGKERQSMQAVLKQAIENYRRQRFLEQANAAFAAWRGDAQSWREEQQERQIWDQALGDGLEQK